MSTPSMEFSPIAFRSRALRLPILVLLSLAAFAFPVNAQSKLDPAILKKVKAATVHIKVKFAEGPPSEGSGFLTTPIGIIITNAHVIGMLDNDSPKPAKVEVTLNSGEAGSKTGAAKILYVDGETDLAILLSPGSPKDLPEPLLLAPTGSVTETQDVFVVGFPLGKRAGANVTITATTVTSLRKEGNTFKAIQVNGGMHPGNSGGPVINSEGKVVGIAVAAYTGTQLHLAIPIESLNAVTNGKISNSQYGVAYKDGDKIHLPLRFQKLDPMKKMKAISVATWVGNPGPTRPSTNGKEPEPQAGDSPLKMHVFKPDDQGIYEGEVVLDAAKDPKQVYMFRYVVDRGKSNAYYQSGTLTARIGTPVERKPATLAYLPPAEKTDVLAVLTESAFRIRESDGDDHSLSMKLAGTVKEKSTAQAKDGTSKKRLNYDGLEAIFLFDKKPIEGADELTKILKGVSLVGSDIDVAKDGTHGQSKFDMSKVPSASKRLLSMVVEQAQQSFDSIAIPLPMKETPSQTTWSGKQTFILGALGKAVAANADITYKYEGLLTRNDKQVAIVSFAGTLKPFSARTGQLTGKVDGKIELAVDTGLVVFATENVKAELDLDFDGRPAKAIGTLNVQVRRNPVLVKKKK